MAEFRGRKNDDSNNDEPSSTAIHQKQPTSILRSSSSLTSRSASKKSASFAVGTDVSTRNTVMPSMRVANNTSRRFTARTRAIIMVTVLLAAVVGSFYLSYGVVLENMNRQNEAMQASKHGKFQQPTSKQQQQVPSTNVIPEKKQHSIEKTLLSEEKKELAPNPNDQLKSGSQSDTTDKLSKTKEATLDKCAFRTYPDRYYGLPSPQTKQPTFLSDATYIRGEWPIIINPMDQPDSSPPQKVCHDTSSWENTKDENGIQRLPFTDGHNPSVVSLSPNPYTTDGINDNDNIKDGHQQHMRLDPIHIDPIKKSFPNHSIDSLFLSVSIFGNGQCKFNMSAADIDKYKFSKYDEPPGGKRTVIALLASPNDDGNNAFQTLYQTTILLERDAKYGTRKKTSVSLQKDTNTNSGYQRIPQELDDPRFFFYNGQLWVLYRNGPLFGYQDQIHNPVHFEVGGDDGKEFVAYIKSSETIRVCCGRNIALISEEAISSSSGGGSDGKGGAVEWVPNPSLKALTWVDPVTVVDVNVGNVGGVAKPKTRRLMEVKGKDNHVEDNTHHAPSIGMGNMAPIFTTKSHSNEHHRRLGSQQPKSNIHGTNGYMVPLPFTGELLGIAHFHRPEHREASDYAMHGHHYTHVFFTIARQQSANSDGNTDGSNTRPFKLKRLSNEFAFRAVSLPSGNDADVIQFASGLDVLGSDVDGQLIISYGINDCEGAAFTVTMEKVQTMLIDVIPGQEVADLMKKIQK